MSILTVEQLEAIYNNKNFDAGEIPFTRTLEELSDIKPTRAEEFENMLGNNKSILISYSDFCEMCGIKETSRTKTVCDLRNDLNELGIDIKAKRGNNEYILFKLESGD